MAFIKEESEDLRIEETFRVKQEETEEQTFIIRHEEKYTVKPEDIEGKIVKHENTEEQTDGPHHHIHQTHTHQQPALPSPPVKVSKRKTVFEKATLKRMLDQKRSKSRINIGVAFPRWRKLKESKGLKDDTMVALFLLDWYERTMASTPLVQGLKRPPTPDAAQSGYNLPNGSERGDSKTEMEEKDRNLTTGKQFHTD